MSEKYDLDRNLLCLAKLFAGDSRILESVDRRDSSWTNVVALGRCPTNVINENSGIPQSGAASGNGSTLPSNVRWRTVICRLRDSTNSRASSFQNGDAFTCDAIAGAIRVRLRGGKSAGYSARYRTMIAVPSTPADRKPTDWPPAINCASAKDVEMLLIQSFQRFVKELERLKALWGNK